MNRLPLTTREGTGTMVCVLRQRAGSDSALIITSAMFVRIASAATAIAMLAHSLLGCCWHHAHAGCADHDLAWLQMGAHHEHHHADHPDSMAAEPQGDDEDSDHRHRAPCVEPNCSFVGTDAPQLIDLPLIATAAWTSDTAAPAATRAVAAGFAAQIDRDSLSTARMRAVLQTWVV